MIQHLKTGPMNFPDVLRHFYRDNRHSSIQTNSECFNVKQTSESITLFSDSLDTIKVLSVISSVLIISWRSILDNTHIDMVFPFPIRIINRKFHITVHQLFPIPVLKIVLTILFPPIKRRI